MEGLEGQYQRGWGSFKEEYNLNLIFFCMYHLSHCLPWSFPLPLSVATTVGDEGHFFYFFFRGAVLCTKGLETCANASLPSSPKVRTLLDQSHTLHWGENEKKPNQPKNNWGGIGRHNNEWNIKDNKTENGFFFPSLLSCMWDNPSIHSYFIPLGFMQGSLGDANGGLQVFLVTALPFAAPCQVRREVSC